MKSTTATAIPTACTTLANNAWSSIIARLISRTNLTFYISNRLIWQAAGITRIRRHRWPVEVYHEEGKAEGLDQYQLRDFSAIQRHVALVAVVYSLLRAAQHDPLFQRQLQRQLQITLEGTAAFWRRATQAQSLWCLGLFISAGLAQGQSLSKIMALFRAICQFLTNHLIGGCGLTWHNPGEVGFSCPGPLSPNSLFGTA